MAKTKGSQQQVQVRTTKHDAAQNTFKHLDDISKEVTRQVAIAKKGFEINKPGNSGRLNTPPAPKKKKNPVAAVPKAMCCAAMSEYANCLSNPFGCRASKGLAQVGNIVPSNSSLCFTTTHEDAFSCAASTSTEIGIYPGHGRIVQDANIEGVDPQSFHCMSTRIGGTTTANDYVVGPIKGDVVPRQAVGYVSEGIVVGGSTTSTNVATCKPIINDVALPFTASQGSGTHTRWRLISCGIRIWNTTDEGNRGDSCQYVQPPQLYNGGNQKSFSIFSPNYALTRKMDTDGGLELVWIPRPQDLGYWHQEDSLAADSSTAGAGIRVWFTTNGNSTQVYRYSIVCHWEVAGVNLAQLQNKTANAIHSESVINTAINTVRSIASTGHGLSKMIHHFAGQAVGLVPALAKTPRILAAAKSVAGFAASV